MLERKKLDIRETKEVLLNILIELDKFCRIHDLKYYLCGGTLLGSIRHKGFIPWDDDIDIMMPRPDYEKLLNWDKEFTWPAYLNKVDWKHKSSPYPFIKIIDTRTYIDEKYISANMNAKSLWIDVFPIDGNANSKFFNQILYCRSLFLRKILKLRIANPKEGKSVLKKAIKQLICPFLAPIDIHWLCDKIDLLAKKYSFDESKCIGGVVWGYGTQETMYDKEGFMKSVDVYFENHIFKAPKNYDEYLSNLYSDYMKLPPESQRVSHDYHAYKVINTQ